MSCGGFPSIFFVHLAMGSYVYKDLAEFHSKIGMISSVPFETFEPKENAQSSKATTLKMAATLVAIWMSARSGSGRACGDSNG